VRTPTNWPEKHQLTRLLTNRDGLGPSPGQAREYVEQLSLPTFESPLTHPDYISTVARAPHRADDDKGERARG
jgi:hypothetical protein